MNDISKLYYYSERGMVNAIVLSIYKYKEAMFHFLKCIKRINKTTVFNDVKLADIKAVSIFNEFSFNDFGDPDLIIRVDFNSKKSQLFFIEAKVKTYKDSVKDNKIFASNSYAKKGNSSRINFQLRLKQRFVKAYNEYLNMSKNEEICSTNDNDYDYKKRLLKKKSVIDFLNNDIMNGIEFDNIFYVSMTSDNDNPYNIDADLLPLRETEAGYNNLCYLLYKDINHKKEGNSRKEVVLYNDTKEMFDKALILADKKYISEEDDGDE